MSDVRDGNGAADDVREFLVDLVAALAVLPEVRLRQLALGRQAGLPLDVCLAQRARQRRVEVERSRHDVAADPVAASQDAASRARLRSARLDDGHVSDHRLAPSQKWRISSRFSQRLTGLTGCPISGVWPSACVRRRDAHAYTSEKGEPVRPVSQVIGRA
jgi:hypothetical protein